MALSRAEMEGRRQAWQAAGYLREQVPGCEGGRLVAFATQIGIRETRRIAGDHVLAADDLRRPTRFDDAIAAGACPIDIHPAQGGDLHCEPLADDHACRPGAGSVVGTQAVAQSHDGRTLLMGSTSTTILPSLRADLPCDARCDLQPIGMVSAQPLVLPVAADSPLKSLGMDEFVIEGWAALFAAMDVPPPAVERLEKALQQALADPSVKERSADFGVDPVPGSRAALRDYVRSEIARWGDVIRSRDIESDRPFRSAPEFPCNVRSASSAPPAAAPSSPRWPPST